MIEVNWSRTSFFCSYKGWTAPDLMRMTVLFLATASVIAEHDRALISLSIGPSIVKLKMPDEATANSVKERVRELGKLERERIRLEYEVDKSAFSHMDSNAASLLENLVRRCRDLEGDKEILGIATDETIKIVQGPGYLEYQLEIEQCTRSIEHEEARSKYLTQAIKAKRYFKSHLQALRMAHDQYNKLECRDVRRFVQHR